MPIGRRCLAEGSKIMVRDQPNSAASLVKADRPALRLPVSLDIVRRDMSISRRHFLAALGSLSVAACDTAIPLVSVARTQAAPPDMRPVPNEPIFFASTQNLWTIKANDGRLFADY